MCNSHVKKAANNNEAKSSKVGGVVMWGFFVITTLGSELSNALLLRVGLLGMALIVLFCWFAPHKTQVNNHARTNLDKGADG